MNLPIGQYYHVSVDGEDPYRVYGGLQDNSSWVGDSSYPGGVSNARWENMYGGDGFWMFVDPTDATYIYAESQGGYVGRLSRRSLTSEDIAMPTNLRDPASGQTYFEAASALARLGKSSTPTSGVAPIAVRMSCTVAVP